MFKQIEDIPLSAFAGGVAWARESYPEYLAYILEDLGINVAGRLITSA